MRGEDRALTDPRSRPSGSPPHARGRLACASASTTTGGITPACAGKTRRLLGARRWRLDHPRMRGEDRRKENPPVGECGSPPHARGRQSRDFLFGQDFRITPACAGKTPPLHPQTRPRKDHPRMRGEDFDDADFEPPSLGSPPHARGRRHILRTRPPRKRITPACAGKTEPRRDKRRGSADHPRMRGEDAKMLAPSVNGQGSPPHARGRRVESSSLGRVGRITPACAGKTASRTSTGTAISDHPRMRGEDVRRQRRLQTLPDHPRMRGEDPRLRRYGSGALGSPPHARGRRWPNKVFILGIVDHPRMRGEDVVQPRLSQVA